MLWFTPRKAFDKGRGKGYNKITGNKAEETREKAPFRERGPRLKDLSRNACGIPPPAAPPNRTLSGAVFPALRDKRRA